MNLIILCFFIGAFLGFWDTITSKKEVEEEPTRVKSFFDI